MIGMNVGERAGISLDGEWGLLPDPMNRAGQQRWWTSRRPEGDFFPSYDDDAFWPTRVPGAFNRIHEKLAYYEGQVVYLRHFEAEPPVGGEQCLLHFDGVADRCRVFLNGQWIGEHDGGFVPFALDATPALAARNRLLVYVDNTRRADGVPGLRHDWWHDGGIHRPVTLYRLPPVHVRDVSLATRLDGDTVHLDVGVLVHAARRDRAHAVRAVLVDPRRDDAPVASVSADAVAGAWARTTVSLPRRDLCLWQPGDPALYRLDVTVGDDTWRDTVGLRELRTRGRSILLNGEPLVLRGVCTWTEDSDRGIFSLSEESAAGTVALVQALHANCARAGHCPPGRELVRACDRAGIVVWAEVPAYWMPTMHEPAESRRALHMLEAMVRTFRNNPSVAIWCIGNECLYNNVEQGQSNLAYFIEAADMLHERDPSRLVTYTGGFEGPGSPGLETICPQRLVDRLDVVSLNSYSGIRDGADPARPAEFGQHREKIRAAAGFEKPVILGEVGIDAVRGEQGFDFGEARQADYHRKVQDLFRVCVAEGLLQGMTPFVLNDFATPIKLGRFQRGYNRKGLVTETFERKAAFDVVREGYATLAAS